MNKIHRILVLSAVSLLALAPAALADTGLDSNNQLGLFIGLCIIAASALVMNLTSRHFGVKRRNNKRRNRARAKSQGKRRR